MQHTNDTHATLLDVLDRARGWIENGGPAGYDMANAEHELEKALAMVRERLDMRDALDAAPTCSCEWADDAGDPEVGPDPYIAQADEACRQHGRDADPEGWARADAEDRRDLDYAIEGMRSYLGALIDNRDFALLSARDVLRKLGHDDDAADAIIRRIAEGGFTYCIDPIIPTGDGDRPPRSACAWCPDQLLSRLGSLFYA